MPFNKIQALYLRCLNASLVCLILLSCQDQKRDTLRSTSAPVQETAPEQQLLIPASFTAATTQQLENQLDSIVSSFHKKRGFNGTVLVTKYNQIIYKGAHGYADFKRKDTLSTQTAFQLASVSKQFTAMAIMMLHEQGKLQYDDSVQQFIPDFPYKGITIRQLLTHRSGLSNYTYFSDKLWKDRKQFMTNEDVLQLMAAHQPEVYYQPNTHFDYSNTGYSLLASIVEKASGMPFSAFMEKHIFEPLNMKNTFTFSSDLPSQGAEIATGYTGGRRKRTPDYLDSVLGDKGVYSTVEDLYLWDQALYTQKLVKRETLEEAFTGSRLKKKRKKEDYGFGWRIRPLDSGDTVVYHAGLWHGYTTYLLRNPRDHSALIVLSNLPNGSMKHLIEDIQEVLYPMKPQNQDRETQMASLEQKASQVPAKKRWNVQP